MSGKGGARNFVKSFIDPGILLEALSKHQDLLQKFGIYGKSPETRVWTQKGCSQSCLWFEVCLRSGDIHSAAVRQVLLRMVTDKPSLNNSEWPNLLQPQGRATECGALSFEEIRIKRRSEEVCSQADCIRISAIAGSCGHVGCPCRSTTGGQERKLKQEVSDATVDSDGYPKCLETPSPKSKKVSGPALAKGKGSPTASLAPSFLRRRKGSQLDNESNQEHDPHLAAAMGFGGGKHAVMKGKFGKALLKGKWKKNANQKKQKVPSKRSPKGQLPTALVPRQKDSHGTSFS